MPLSRRCETLCGRRVRRRRGAGGGGWAAPRVALSHCETAIRGGSPLPRI